MLVCCCLPLQSFGKYLRMFDLSRWRLGAAAPALVGRTLRSFSSCLLTGNQQASSQTTDTAIPTNVFIDSFAIVVVVVTVVIFSSDSLKINVYSISEMSGSRVFLQKLATNQTQEGGSVEVNCYRCNAKFREASKLEAVPS